MDPNMALIVGLSSGLAFLNIVVFSLWYLWERKRRKTKDLERDNKLTSLNYRPRKLVKRNRPFPPPRTHTLPEKHDTHSHSEPVRHSEPIYLPSPYDFPQPPKHRTVRPLGLSPLRNELCHAPSVQRRASTESGDTASVYSTMSAPIHLHEEMLSETSHSSFLTADTLDTLHIEKFDTSAYDESSSTAMDNESYFIQDRNLRPETCGSTYGGISAGVLPNHNAPLQQRTSSSEIKREMCSVLPFHATHPSSKSQPGLPERFSPAMEEDFPSWLLSPYSP